MNEVAIHEYKLKLICLSVEAQNAIVKVTEQYCVQSSIAKDRNIVEPDEALSVILNDCLSKNTLCKVKKLSFKDYKSKIFDSNPPRTIKSRIKIQELDVTILNDLLSNVEEFPTYQDKTELSCKDLTLPGCHDEVCCSQCMTCFSCSKIVTSPSCDTSVISAAISFLTKARNFTAHIEFAECEKIENGDYSSINLPNCDTWDDVLGNVTKSILAILDILQRWIRISSEDYNKAELRIKVVINFSYIHYSSFYVQGMKAMMLRNNCIVESEKELVATTKSLVLSFQGNKEKRNAVLEFWTWFSEALGLKPLEDSSDLDSPEMEQLLKKYKNKVKEVLETELGSNSFEIKDPKIEHLPPLFGTPMNVRLEINFADQVPACYHNRYSLESKELRQQLKNELKTVLTDVLGQQIFVRSIEFHVASIHIKYEISKGSEDIWTTEEQEKVYVTVEKILSRESEIGDSMQQIFGTFQIVISCNVHENKDNAVLKTDISCFGLDIFKKMENSWYLLENMFGKNDIGMNGVEKEFPFHDVLQDISSLSEYCSGFSSLSTHISHGGLISRIALDESDSNAFSRLREALSLSRSADGSVDSGLGLSYLSSISDMAGNEKSELKLLYREAINRQTISEERKKNHPIDRTWNYNGEVIPYDEILVRFAIGHGGFGEVYAAMWKGYEIAIKKLRSPHEFKTADRKRFHEEVRVISQLKHKNVVVFIGICNEDPNICIIMELMEGSLHDKIHIEQFHFQERDEIFILTELALGLDYLHKMNVAHCDMKPKNVLINTLKRTSIEVKISDFGLSMMKSYPNVIISSGRKVSCVGTPTYAAPERLQGNELNRDAMKKTDIYSFGLIVHELLTKKFPFQGMNVVQLIFQVGSGVKTPATDDDDDLDEDIKRFIKSCWCKIPDERPTSSECYEIFNGILNRIDSRTHLIV